MNTQGQVRSPTAGYRWPPSLSHTLLLCSVSPENFLHLPVLTPCILVVHPGLVMYTTVDKVCLNTVPHTYNRESYNTSQIGDNGNQAVVCSGWSVLLPWPQIPPLRLDLFLSLLLEQHTFWLNQTLWLQLMTQRCLVNPQSQFWPRIKWDTLLLSSVFNHIEPLSLESYLRNAQR